MNAHTHTHTHTHTSIYTVRKTVKHISCSARRLLQYCQMPNKISRHIKGIFGNFCVTSKKLFQSFIHSTISCETSNDVLRNPGWETMVYSLIVSTLENTFLMFFFINAHHGLKKLSVALDITGIHGPLPHVTDSPIFFSVTQKTVTRVAASE